MSAARLSSQLPTRPELLRARYEDVKDNPHKRLVPILSPNPKPLYVRNLIRLLPRCDSTHEDINRLQRKHSFHYAYEESDTERKCLVIGYQFRENASADEIARGVQKLRASKRRLVESRKQWNPVYQREAQQRLQQRRARLQTRPDAPLLQRREGTRVPSTQNGLEELGKEKRGEWRSRLIGETFSPFIEVFPIDWDFYPIGQLRDFCCIVYGYTCIDCPRMGKILAYFESL